MDILQNLRNEIDQVDNSLVNLLAKRFQICEQVIKYKSLHNIPMMQPERVQIVKNRFVDLAKQKGIPENFAYTFIDSIISASCKYEEDILTSLTNKEIS
jgi:chorismate mutase-like protein